MTHTGAGDKCSRWERGVTVDKARQRLREGERDGEEVRRGGVEVIDRTQETYCALNFAYRLIQLCQFLLI